MSARNLRLWPVKWISIPLQTKCGWWCWGAEGRAAVVVNSVGSLLAEAEGTAVPTAVFKWAIICSLPKIPPLATKSLTSQRGGKNGRHLFSVAILKNKISSFWHLCPDPGKSQEDACSLDLVYSLACQPRFADPCGIPWGLRLWSWFWAESNAAGAHGSLFLAWNGGWFWMSLLAECVPSWFSLVCICIFNVYVSSELCRRPFLSETNKLFTMLHSNNFVHWCHFNFSATVPGLGGFFCLFVRNLYCLD